MQLTVSYTVNSFLLTRRGEQEYNTCRDFRGYNFFSKMFICTMTNPITHSYLFSWKWRLNLSENEQFQFFQTFKGVLHLWALFLRTLRIFSKNKATLDKVSHGSGQKYSKELQNHSFTSVGTIVVKLQWKMCENQCFPCFEP